jgi:hypothetical protein
MRSQTIRSFLHQTSGAERARATQAERGTGVGNGLTGRSRVLRLREKHGDFWAQNSAQQGEIYAEEMRAARA